MASRFSYRDAHQNVLRGIPVQVDTTAELSVPEAIVDTEVTRHGGLPLQVGIGQDVAGLECHGTLVAVPCHFRNPELLPETGVDVVVTSCTVRETKLQIVEPLACTGHERLVGETPTEGSRGEVTPVVVRSKVRATVRTESGSEEIASHQRVVDTSEPRQCVLGLVDGVVEVGRLLGLVVVVVLHVVHLNQTKSAIHIEF